MTVTLRGDLLDELIRHSKACLPLEACGFLTGHGGVADRFVPAPNALESGEAFQVEPSFLFKFFRRLRTEGREVVGIVHSHPAAPPVPSTRDLGGACDTRAAHVIVSLEGGRPEIRAYRIDRGAAAEIELRVIV